MLYYRCVYFRMLILIVLRIKQILISAIGRLCEKCDGKCVICDSYVRPCTLVRICDECNYGSYQGRCVICGGPGVSDAYYCKECTIQEKDVSIRKRIVWKKCRYCKYCGAVSISELLKTNNYSSQLSVITVLT